MRRGLVFRRCTKCGSRVTDRRCERCNGERSTWAYAVDVAPKGAARQQKTKAGFATKAEAVAAVARLQTEKEDGTYVEPSKLTVRAYLEGWLAGLSAPRASTRSSYEVITRVHLLPIIGSVPLQQLTRARVKALYEELHQSGRANGPRGGLSVKSVHNVHLCLRKALADAVDDGLLRANPAERAHRLPNDRAEMATWTAAELRQFLAATEQPNFALWRLASNTGMRRGELLGLRWSDVDLEAGRLSVRQQLVRAGKQVAFGPPKTKAGRRSITLDGVTVDVLRSHRARQNEEGRLRLGTGYRSDLDLVFARPDGSPTDPDVISQQFEAATRRASVKRIRLHDLRHTHASLALQAGIHPKVVQERLGHSSIAVTLDRYSHVIPALHEDAAARIAAVVDA